LATVLAAAALSVSAPPASSAQAGPSRAQVRAMLSGVEDVPTDEAWRRLGEGALGVLIELYADPDEAPYVRLRAVGASGAFARPAARTFLLAVARAEGQADLFVREAVLSLGRAFGASALDELTPFLAHREPVVREATARALGRVGGPRAAGALRARLQVEREAVVREALQRALR
jgi:HEAT repeat protein